jgi:general secretion pathway protein E
MTPAEPNKTGGRPELSDVLLNAGLVGREELEAAESGRQDGQSVTDILVSQGAITAHEVAVALSLQLNLPLIELKRHAVQPHAISLVPEDVARRYNAVPLDVIGDELIVVMENPLDIQAIEDISLSAGLRVRPAVGVLDDIEDALDICYRAQTEIERQIEQIAPAPTRPAEGETLTPEAIAESPVARVVELILGQAVRDRASDVHIIPDEGKLRVRYRIDGLLHDSLRAPLSIHGPLVSRVKVMAGMNIAERRRPQDGQFSFETGDGEVDVRVATIDTVEGEMAVLRILDKSLSLLDLDDLGFLPPAMAAYSRLYTLPFGMILVAGPTGSGKTTTLYATINRLDRNEYNVMTIEDPIEYQFDRVAQIQVNRQAGITFAAGLRAIMRLDPDVILVGEIRDQETAEIAVQAALTGHLVLSSIHANDSVGALFRLIDLGVEPFLVMSALVGVVAQRLVRRICEHCGAKAEVSPEERLAYESEMGAARSLFNVGSGCNFCAQTGFRGRTGVFEVLTITEAIRRLLMKGAGAEDIKEQATAEGLVPMRRDGMIKVKEGITTPGEVVRNVFTIQ